MGGGIGRRADQVKEQARLLQNCDLLSFFAFEVCCHWAETTRRDPIWVLGPHNAVLIHILPL